MRIIVTLLVSYLLACEIVCVRGKIFDLDDDESCCRLEWKPIISNGESSHFIPVTATPVKLYSNWGRYIFQFDSNDTTFNKINVGFISNRVNELPRKFEQGEASWTNGAVLSNINNCVMSWIRGRTMITGEMNPPTMDGNRFTRSEKAFGMSNASLCAVDLEDPTQDQFIKLDDSMEHLFINCYASLRNQVLFELAHIDITDDNESLSMTESEEIFATRHIVNDASHPITVRVDLDPERMSSLEIYHHVNFNSSYDVKWRITDSRFTKLFVTSVGAGIDVDPFIQSLIKNGQYIVKMKEKIIKFSQDVTVAPATETQIRIKGKVLRGNSHFTAKYRIVPKASVDMWTNSRIINSLKRAGFDDWNKIVSENGTLTVSYPGQFALDSIYDTQLHITSKDLVQGDADA